MFNFFVSQSLEIPKTINHTINQISLFCIGIFVSLIFGLLFIPFVYTLSDLIWYTVGIVVPMLPGMIGMEKW